VIKRLLSKSLKDSKKSILLLGPRQVGKSTLIKELRPDLTINLALQNVFLDYSSDAGKIIETIDTYNPKSIFIDEVQRLPSLLNTIQAIVDNDKSLKFYLTGSSARKLKRGRANLLPGRVFSYQLGPFVAKEFNYEIDTKKALRFGTLPDAYLSTHEQEAKKILVSYTGSYLKEEIQAEALTRNLESFSRFIRLVSTQVGQFIDYSKFSKKAKISRHSCARYFEVLEDTLIGQRLFPYEPCIESGDLIKHPKFYLFDPGVYNGMVSNFNVSADRLGALAESLVYSQLVHSAYSNDKSINLSTFRTRGGLEVDFIAEIEGDVFAIEVKSTDNIIEDDTRGLRQIENYFSKKPSRFLLHMGTQKKKINGVWCLPWQQGLREMGL